ncbi:MAG: hydrogenase formation protein HypD [Candidatus Omnitrophota bacterium]|jgi:hydrogenase expression/formation protein HypD
MRYEKLLRDKKLIQQAFDKIRDLNIKKDVNIMEVSGTHTYTFFRFGLRRMLPANIHLISGPGCPVCITEDIFIDKAVILARDKSNIIATFGDLIKVRGAKSSLEDERALGANISVVYSPSEAIELAVSNPKKRIIFLGVGFETTAPLSAAIVKEAKQKKLNNFFLLSSHRLIPPALRVLCEDKDINIDGFLCPGHVSAIIGAEAYRGITQKFHKPCVIGGFEPLDMLIAMYKICLQVKEKKSILENEYDRVVKQKGNFAAMKLLDEVFLVKDASWRGFGVIKKSGLFLNKKYKKFDALELIPQSRKEDAKAQRKINNCRCADVVKGKIKPSDCPLFKKICNPDKPLGPCMISFEGSCRIYYEYGG